MNNLFRAAGTAAWVGLAGLLATPQPLAAADPDQPSTLERVQAPFNAVRGFIVGLFGGQGEHGENAASHPVHWGYEGPTGPRNWGQLDPRFAACGDGTEQSPINLTDPTRAELPNLNVAWQPVPVKVVNNGHTIQVNAPEGSTLTIDGQLFHLLQFHFHHPSEHLVDGVPYPMEAHFVHQSDDGGTLAVVGVFFEPGDENATLEQIWTIMPRQPGTAEDASTLDPATLLPEDRNHYHYAGSLTTPPCTEVVQWYVLRTPIKASPQQIQTLTAIFENDARPVQALNRRKLLSTF